MNDDSKADPTTAPGPQTVTSQNQIDPEWRPSDWRYTQNPDWVLYTFLDADKNALGAVLAVAVEGSVSATLTTYKGQKEYWSIDPSTITTAVSVSASAGLWTGAAPLFPVANQTSWYRMVETPRWESTTVPDVTLLFGVGPKTTSPEKKTLFGFVVNLDDDKKPISWTWYNGYAGDTAPTFAVSGPTDLVLAASPPEGEGYPTVTSWRKATVTVGESGTF